MATESFIGRKYRTCETHGTGWWMDCLTAKDCHNFKKFILLNNRGLLLVYRHNILFRPAVFTVWYVAFLATMLSALTFFIPTVLEADNNVGFCRG